MTATPSSQRPDFSVERLTIQEIGGGLVCGVDEVGRGPLAGPVVAAAAILGETAAGRLIAAGATDSKKLSPERRAAVLREIEALTAEGALDAGVGAASTAEIAALNILGATHLAMRRAVARLDRRPDLALVDGDRAPTGLGCAVRTVIKGDLKVLSIAAASILAKELRDRAMRRLARRYPAYGWDTNAGYPTAAHRAALAVEGPSPHHRRGFGSVAAARGAA